jgi:minor extracellular serine protease Vpr
VVSANLFSLSGGSNAIGTLAFSVNVGASTNAQVAQPSAVLNAASYPKANGLSPNNITPGSLAAIFGSQLADGQQSAPTPFPSTLDNVTVQLGGQSLPLYYVSPGQVNALIPWELDASANQLTVVRNGTQSNPIAVTVVNAQPAIFTTNERGGGQAAVVLANTKIIAGTGKGAQAVSRGSYIEIYCTGLGPVSNTPKDGAPAPSSPPLATSLVEPTVTIGGVNAPVTFSGLAPGFVGLYQVDAQVPANAPTGNAVPILISVGNAQSPSGVTIAVQ